MHKIKYSLYPNNEVRIVHYYSRDNVPVKPTSEEGAGDFPCPGTSSNPEGGSERSVPPSLDISSKVDQRDSKMPHRRTKFGLSAKRTILRLGGAYDTIDNTPENYIFLTGTIPGGTHDAFMAVAVQSSYITHSIAKWLKRTCPSPYWFYVWELQKRGALHIHYCIHAPDTRISDKILSGWRAKWESILEEVGAKTGTDMWLRKDGTHHKEGHDVLQAYAQKVRKSVAAYLSGYCGGAKDKHSTDFNSPYYPGRWWGCSRESTKLLRGLTKEVVAEYSDFSRASREMKLAHEAILSATPHAYHYPHKVGIGSTSVSYHPEDKGTSIWQQLTMTIHNPVQFPNASSWILALEAYTRTWLLYWNASKKRKEKDCQRLAQDCEGILSQGSLSRYTLDQRTIRTILRMNAALSLSTIAQSATERTMSVLVPPIWTYWQVQPLLRWNPHQWLSLEKDLPVRLTDCPYLSYSRTTNPKGLDEVPTEGGQSNSDSPSLPPSEQLWLFLDSLEHPQQD